MELIIPFIIVAILLIVLIAFARLVSFKCPECKELNTLEEIDRIKIDERMVNETKSIKKPILDDKGKETGQFFNTTESVIKIEDIYDVTYKCSNCGHTFKKRESKTR